MSLDLEAGRIRAEVTAAYVEAAAAPDVVEARADLDDAHRLAASRALSAVADRSFGVTPALAAEARLRGLEDGFLAVYGRPRPEPTKPQPPQRPKPRRRARRPSPDDPYGGREIVGVDRYPDLFREPEPEPVPTAAEARSLIAARPGCEIRARARGGEPCGEVAVGVYAPSGRDPRPICDRHTRFVRDRDRLVFVD